MKNITLNTAAALILSTGAAMAVTVDFEAQSGFYNASTPSSVFSGIVFDRDIHVSDNIGAPGPGQSGNVMWASTPPFGAQPRGGDVGGLFDGFTVSALSFVVGDSGNDSDIFQLFGYDSSGAIIADSGIMTSDAAITVSIATSGIASFLLEIGDRPDTGGSSVIDNINFEVETVASVPLPASLPLIGFGLATLGAFARRRKS